MPQNLADLVRLNPREYPAVGERDELTPWRRWGQLVGGMSEQGGLANRDADCAACKGRSDNAVAEHRTSLEMQRPCAVSPRRHSDLCPPRPSPPARLLHVLPMAQCK